MKTKSKNKLSRWILLAGIIIWGAGLASGLIFESCGVRTSGQDNLFGSLKLIFCLFPIPMLLWLCVIQPVIEEFAFRFWGTGKKYAYIISLVGIVFFTATTFMNIMVPLVSACICACIMFSIRNESLKNVLLVCCTSLIFAIVHITGFSHLSWTTVLQLFQILGLAIVSCYLVMNYRFIYGCCLHISNNLVGICLPLMLSPTTATFSDDGYTAEISRVSVFETSGHQVIPFSLEFDPLEIPDTNTNTVSFFGELPEIAYMITSKNWNTIPNTMYVAKADNSSFWSRHKYAVHYGDPINKERESLIRGLLENSTLKTDTTYEFAYIVDICDIGKFNKKDSTNGSEQPLSFLINHLREYYGIPFILENGINESAPIHAGHELFESYKKSRKEMINIIETGDYTTLFDLRMPPEKLFEVMEKEHGLKVTKSTNTKIQMITFHVE